MKYTVTLAGVSELGKYLGGREVETEKLGKQLTLPRFGFFITVKNSNPPKFPDLMKIKVPADICSLLAKKLPEPALALIRPALSNALTPKLPFERVVLDQLEKLKLDELKVVDGFVDILETPLGGKLNELAAKLRLGNRGEAKVSKLRVNAHTGAVDIEFSMRVLHVVSLEEVLKASGKSAEALTGEAARKWNAAKQNVDALKANLANQQGRLGGLTTSLEQKAAAVLSAEQIEAAGHTAIAAALKGKEAAQHAARGWEAIRPRPTLRSDLIGLPAREPTHSWNRPFDAKRSVGDPNYSCQRGC